MAELRGVVPAVVTPFDAEGNFNEPVFAAILEANIQAGVNGFWIGGGSGESVLLDDEENHRLALAASQVGAGRVTNIMHVGAATTKRAARLAERAAGAGVDALCCVPPFFYAVSEKAIIEHYRALASASDLPLLLYNLPTSTGVNITPDMAERIRDAVPSVCGLKHSGPIIEHVHDFSVAGFSCFIGYSTLLLPALTMGAVGGIDGPLAVAPELWVAVYRAFCDGDLPAAIAAQKKATNVANAIYEVGFLDALKSACSARYRVECGVPRQPQLGLDEGAKKALLDRLTELDVL